MDFPQKVHAAMNISHFLLSTSPIFQAWKPQGVPWPKQQDPWPAISRWFTRNMDNGELSFFLMVRFFFVRNEFLLMLFFLWHEIIDGAFSDSLHRRSAVCRAFADGSGDVPEGEQETARLPGERVRQGPTGVSAAFSCGSWSTVSLFHIKNPATIKAYYNQCIFTGHIHWVSLISSHSGWGLKTIQDHMNPFN